MCELSEWSAESLRPNRSRLCHFSHNTPTFRLLFPYPASHQPASQRRLNCDSASYCQPCEGPVNNKQLLCFLESPPQISEAKCHLSNNARNPRMNNQLQRNLQPILPSTNSNNREREALQPRPGPSKTMNERWGQANLMETKRAPQGTRSEVAMRIQTGDPDVVILWLKEERFQ